MRFIKLFALSLWACPLSSHAQTIRTLFMSTDFYTAIRISLQTAVPQATGSERGPVINFSTEMISVNGRSLSLSTIKGLSFTVQTVDGIMDQTLATNERDKVNVYLLNGQLVRSNAKDLEGLPKGVYIVNGKKYVVK